MNWNNYYMEQAGGSAEFSSVYRGAPWQRGYVLGGYFKRFLTWVIPMIKDAAIATAKSGAKTVGREALSGVAKKVIKRRKKIKNLIILKKKSYKK